MGFFDRFSAKKPAPAPVTTPATPPAATPPAEPAAAPTPTPVPAAGGVKPRLLAAREQLDLKDLPGALAIYEEVLAAAGDRADVLVAISGDLGSHGHVAEIIELVAPRYDAERHGPATGLNILQAYLAVRNADAAQHVLDILFTLNRPELEERLHGFSNAIADILAGVHSDSGDAPGRPGSEGVPKVNLVSISKPIWFYGLEPLADRILPAREARVRRIAFAQLALPGHHAAPEAARNPEDELGRFSRALPLWFAETFSFSPHYAPIAAIAVLSRPEGGNEHMTFGAEWTPENLRQLVDSTSEGLDYVFTGAVRDQAGDYELVLRVWEVKKFRERKSFQVRWTPATADAELARLHELVRTFMEWSPAAAELAYAPPAQPRAWLDTLGASLGLFLAEKTILPASQPAPVADDLRRAAERAGTGDAAALAYLTLRARAARLGVAEPTAATFAATPLVAAAEHLLCANG